MRSIHLCVMNHRLSRLLSSLALVVLGILIGCGLSFWTGSGAGVASSPQKTSSSPLMRTDLTQKVVRAVDHPVANSASLPNAPIAEKWQPWKLRKNLNEELKKRLAILRQRLQSAEHARAVFATKETPETSAVEVEIKAASEAEQKRFWEEVNHEADKLEPELRTYYEVDARRLLDQFLAFPKKFRVLVVVTYLPKEGGGYQDVHFVFNTDSPEDFVLGEDVVVTTPPSIQLLSHITPWRDQVTQEPSDRYGYLVKMEN